MIETTCSYCNKLFIKKLCNIGEKNYCTHKCYSESRKIERVLIQCDSCDKEFYRKKTIVGKKNYCSINCLNLSQYKQVKTVCANCGVSLLKAPSYIKANNYCSRECSNSREHNPAWSGGSSNKNQLLRTTKEYKDWRFNIFKRDNWTCSRCGKRGESLEAHHIMSFARFSELQLELDNGITLCKKCHKGFHILYGLKSFTSDDLYEWMKE